MGWKRLDPLFGCLLEFHKNGDKLRFMKTSKDDFFDSQSHAYMHEEMDIVELYLFKIQAANCLP